MGIDIVFKMQITLVHKSTVQYITAGQSKIITKFIKSILNQNEIHMDKSINYPDQTG